MKLIEAMVSHKFQYAMKGLLRKRTGQSSGHYDANALFMLFNVTNPSEDKKREWKGYKTGIFDKLRKRLDNDDPDPNHASVTYMPRLSGDAGKPPVPGSDAVNNTDSAITQVIYHGQEVPPIPRSLRRSRGSSTSASRNGRTTIISTWLTNLLLFPHLNSKRSKITRPPNN